MQPIKGFSKLSKEGKLEWLAHKHFHQPEEALALLRSYWHSDPHFQKLHDEFIENTITNFVVPYGVAPNFLIDGEEYTVPMAIEESSVVAAAAKAATFWSERGGFHTTILGTEKIGHVHFIWHGENPQRLYRFFERLRPMLYEETADITANMRGRGGGITGIELVDKSAEEAGYFQLQASFETVDSMGANFINSVLERFADVLRREIARCEEMPEAERNVQVVMCILSNYTPNCRVRSEVRCPKSALVEGTPGISAEEFIEKFSRAVRIAEIEPYRATTHNKGVMNGIDAVVLATGNDFRAVESCVHTFAGRTGRYQSLTHVDCSDDTFCFYIEVPMALGTVGGLTGLHPLVKFSLQLLDNPSASRLMAIAASTGLAQNFGALRSLVTTGIQKGHMKMHLLNILNQLEATEEERKQTKSYFADKIISFNEVARYLRYLRGEPVDHPSSPSSPSSSSSK
jgi:hydroxymethylglutaryl-CoA reductase